MKILSTSDDDISIAAEAIRNGELVAFPTETVYGLGANVWNETALAHIFEAKKRPTFDPLIVHISKASEATEVGDMEVPYAKELASHFWPGPLTMVLPKRNKVPGLATSNLPTVAVRCPSNSIARLLIEKSGVPIAAPSANLFGHLSPTRAEHVAAQLGSSIKYIINGGKCNVGIESTVLDLSTDTPMVLRPGGLPMEALQEIIPNLETVNRTVANPKSPGQLKNHYAPTTPLYLVEAGTLINIVPRQNSVAICFGKISEEILHASDNTDCAWAKILNLSQSMDTKEAANMLFDTLSEIDKMGFTEIWVEKLPNEGLGTGVNDRLFKASKKN